MQKVTSILFTFFYLMLSIGVAINVHYCGGEVKDVAFFVDAESCCDDSNACDCCDNETFLIQNLQEGVVLQSDVFHFSPVKAPLEVNHAVSQMDKLEVGKLAAFVEWASPPESDLWLKFCTLTYYG